MKGEKRKNNRRILLIVFLAIVITLIIVMGGFTFFKNPKANRENTEELKNNSSKLQEEIGSVSNIDNIVNLNNNTIKEVLSPSGFVGSSTIEVVLYSDNKVYVINYDGSGYEKNNIIGKTLIAKNADAIEYNGQGEMFESIIVKGKKLEIVETPYNWIEFHFK